MNTWFENAFFDTEMPFFVKKKSGGDLNRRHTS